jgi:hypothetical protein
VTKLEAIGKIASCGRATDGEKMRAVELVLEFDESRAQEIASRFPSGAEILEAIISVAAEDELSPEQLGSSSTASAAWVAGLPKPQTETHNHPPHPPSLPITGQGGSVRDKFAR